jgi:peptidoglycan/xylan/chitin deacetylase (PgdA/CDA1 family)
MIPIFRKLKRAASPVAKGVLSDVASLSGLYRLTARKYGGVGTIFTLHRVAKSGYPILYPGYMIHADALDAALRATRRAGWDIVGLDEMADRLERGDSVRRFACFTLDDGYLDNLRVALPVFRAHRAPFAVYICTGLLDRTVFYWWGGLEELVRANERIEFTPPGGSAARVLTARTWEEKLRAYDSLDELCHKTGPGVARDLFARYGIDEKAALDRDALTPAQARELAADPLVTIGAHTMTHPRLIQLSDDDAYRELHQGKRLLEETLGVEVRHLAYPFGGPDACGKREVEFARQAGYRTAVTTRWGNVFPAHRDYLHCLPRRGAPANRIELRNMLSGAETRLRRQPIFRTL